MSDLWQTLVHLVENLGELLYLLLLLAMTWALLLAWVAWWLWGVNWHRAWPVLRQGAWVGLVMLVVLGAFVWSQVAPHNLNLSFTQVPNFWWQLIGVSLLAALTLFCGWLQGYMGWTPAEIPIYPDEDGHAHEDGHGHGAETAHGHAPVTSHAHGGHH